MRAGIIELQQEMKFVHVARADLVTVHRREPLADGDTSFCSR
jgi:hypothetical protein